MISFLPLIDTRGSSGKVNQFRIPSVERLSRNGMTDFIVPTVVISVRISSASAVRTPSVSLSRKYGGRAPKPPRACVVRMRSGSRKPSDETMTSGVAFPMLKNTLPILLCRCGHLQYLNQSVLQIALHVVARTLVAALENQLIDQRPE